MVRAAEALLIDKKLVEQNPVRGLRVWTAEPRFRFDGVAELSPGPRLRVWATEPGLIVKGLAEQNQG